MRMGARDAALGAFTRTTTPARGSSARRLPGGGFTGGKRHFVADLAQMPDQTCSCPLRMQAVEIIAAQFPVLAAIPDDVIGQDQNAMRYCYGGLLHPAAVRYPVEHCRQKGILGMCRGPRALHQNPPQVTVAFTRLTREALPSALRIPWTETGPALSMPIPHWAMST